MAKDTIAITNRKLCTRPFLDVMRDLSQKEFKTIVLREKDLSKDEYKRLAMECLQVMEGSKTTLTVHNFVEVAEELEIPRIHLPYPIFLKEHENLEKFQVVSTSIHCVEEAIDAQQLGADYVIAGHIFATDCKKGLEPRGIEFLQRVVDAVSIPVYGIGGMNQERIRQVRTLGAAGGCMMSGLMK